MFDIARRKWGYPCRLPSKNELQELIDRCIFIPTQKSSIRGVKIVGPNGNSIFIPFAGGSRADGDIYYKGDVAHVWAGECNDMNGYKAYSLLIKHMRFPSSKMKNNVFLFDAEIYTYDRADWHSVRPVYTNTQYANIAWYRNNKKNNKVTIKGQIRNLLNSSSDIEKVKIINASTNDLICILTRDMIGEWGVFEISVIDGIKLKFEVDGYESIETELHDNIILDFQLINAPKFGLG